MREGGPPGQGEPPREKAYSEAAFRVAPSCLFGVRRISYPGGPGMRKSGSVELSDFRGAYGTMWTVAPISTSG